MSEGGLFREEAVREFLRGRDERRLLPISPRWLGWTWWLLAAFAAALAAFALFVPMDVEVQGPAVVSAREHGPLEVAAMLSAADAARVGDEATLVFFAAGLPASAPLRVSARDAGPGGLVRVHAALPESTALVAGIAGRASVVVARRPLAASFLRGGLR